MRPPLDLQFCSSDGVGYTEPLTTKKFSNERFCRIILIHGFLSSETGAMESYDWFRSYFSEHGGFLTDKLFCLVWQGDQFSGNPIRYFDENVQNAIEFGRLLGRYLHSEISDEKTPCQYVIVAHSLGCRLAAAMIDELHRINADACRQFKFFLMAGAVPTNDIGPGGMFFEGLKAAESVANLYSTSDGVLRILFPLGELGGFRFASEPIGLNGQPLTFSWSMREHMVGFGHTDYWRKSSAAETVARALGASVANVLPSNIPDSYHPPEHDSG